jgi:hypothetical protein
MIPTRVQRSRRAGAKLPESTLCCTRPAFWSNPFTGDNAAKWFRLWLIEFPHVSASHVAGMAANNGERLSLDRIRNSTGMIYHRALDELRDYQHLACWCPLDAECHVDALIELLKRNPK